MDAGKCSKISNIFLFLFSNKMFVLGLEFRKMLADKQTGKTSIRLVLSGYALLF